MSPRTEPLSGGSSLTPLVTEQAWAEISARLQGRPFLRSEGMGAPLGVPQRCAPALVEAGRELVRVFHRFYRAVVDCEGALQSEPARLVGEPYECIAVAEGARDPLPLARYDCVLDRAGALRVIELNPIGVSTLHLRAVSYLGRILQRMREPESDALASVIDELRAKKVASIRGFVDGTLAAPPARPTLGLPLLHGMHRGSAVFWKQELEGAGLDVVFGRPDELCIEGGVAKLRDRRVDALWVDWFLYLGYQQTRYEQTRFASKVGDFSKASAAAERLLTLPGMAESLRDRALTLISPLRGYRALSKALLAWIERPALAISDEDRRFLRAHVTRTHDHAERLSGVITPETARKERAALVLKPCRFGGSHGVLIGVEVAPEEWARRLDEVWSDPEWVLQAYAEPVADAHGARLSFGLYDYGGELGGVLVRRAKTLIVSARTAEVIVAVTAAGAS